MKVGGSPKHVTFFKKQTIWEQKVFDPKSFKAGIEVGFDSGLRMGCERSVNELLNLALELNVISAEGVDKIHTHVIKLYKEEQNENT